MKIKKALKIASIPVAAYGALFAVFYFDLDGKLLYYVVEPFMKNHFDKMERRDPHSVPYPMMNENGEFIK
jgi:hypothetical protein